MKTSLTSVRNLFFLIFLSCIPMVVGMAANAVIKGNLNFVFTYLDGTLWLIGGVLAYFAFKGTHEVTFPKGKKPSAALLFWAFVFSFSSVFIILSYMLINSDEEPKMNVAKQFQAVFIGSVAEEIVCRLLMTAVIKNNRKCFSIAAVIITSILWTIMHSPTTFNMVRLIISGIILSIIYQLTNNLSVCILYHMGNNVAVTAALYFGLSAGKISILAASVAVALISSVFLFKEVRKKALAEGTFSHSALSAATLAREA